MGMEEPDLFDIAWAAGLFEGEGTVSLKPPFSCAMGVSSTDRDIIERFQQVMGGTIYGPYDRGRNKPISEWGMYGWKNVESVFQLFRPWLGKRRIEQFERVLAKRPPPRQYPPSCGRTAPGAVSEAGAAWHRRHGEPTCGDCARALAAYRKLQRHRAKERLSSP